MKMMRSLSFALVLAASFFVAGSASADAWSGALPAPSISAEDINSGQLVYVAFPSDIGLHSCSIKNGWMMLGGRSTSAASRDANVKAMTSLFTSALLAGRNVKVYVGGCTGGGTTGYPIIYAAQIL